MPANPGSATEFADELGALIQAALTAGIPKEEILPVLEDALDELSKATADNGDNGRPGD